MFKKIILLILLLVFISTFGFTATELDKNRDGKIDSDLLPIDTTTTLGTSDVVVPSQNAVKTYVDTKAPIANPTFTGTVKGIISGTNGNCVKIGADGTISDNGAACSAAMVYPSVGIPVSTGSAWDSPATYSTVIGLFGSGTCSGYLKSDGTCDTPAAVLPEPGAANAVVYSNGSAWIRSDTPVFSTLSLTGADSLSIGTASSVDGSVIFKNATNTNTFTILSGVSAAAIGWTLPTAAPGGANYLLNVDADGTMGYTDPASLVGTGDVATDTIWAAAGDLAYGTGNDTASILSKGTAYQLLMMNSGATAPAWTSTLGSVGTPLTAAYFTTIYADVISSTADDGSRGVYLGNNTTYTASANEDSIVAIAHSIYVYENAVKSKAALLMTTAGTGGNVYDGITFGDAAATTTGRKACMVAKFNMKLTGWYMLAPGAAATAVIDVWKTTGGIPTNTNSMCNGHEPVLSSAQYGTDTDISDWSTQTVTKGDVICFNVDSSDQEELSLTLVGTRTE